MNKSSPLSSPPTPPFRPTSAATTATRLTPAVIPLDYNYRIMSPSSYTHSNKRLSSTYHGRESTDVETMDNQYGSIFGDPVPPPPPAEFYDFQNAQNFPRLYRDIESSEEDTSRIGGHARLFPTEPFNSISTPLGQQEIFNLMTPSSSRARLQPPDIQILPNSSGGSSSDQLGSPNFTLLRPDDILTKPALYENTYATDVSELLETITIKDATGTKEYSEIKRRVSNISDDFRSNVGTFRHSRTDKSSSTPQTLLRRDSNESYSSEDWFLPATRDFPEFSKIPKLRPSSKNIMSIKNNEMPTQFSPVAAMFNDSSGSEDRASEPANISSKDFPKDDDDIAPIRPPIPCPEAMFELQGRQSTSDDEEQHFESQNAQVLPSRPATALQEDEPSESVQREMSPVIKTNLIYTGSDHRVQTPRLHKKTSFTILSDKSTQSSLAPTPIEHTQRRSSVGTPSIGSRPVAMPRYHLPQKSLTSTQLKLPQISNLKQFTSDDSPRQSVQFDMTGRLSPFKMSQKGILQHRESLSSSQDALPTAIFPYSQKNRSYEALPLITDPYRTSIPRLDRSTMDIGREAAIFPPGSVPRPLRPNPNPTRRQKGLLRVFTREEILSRIPLRSNWNSMDDLSYNRFRKHRLASLNLQKRRRSSSTSPERRSSTQTGSDRRSSNLSSVTTSDFSFRRTSIMSSMQQRRSSVLPATVTPKRRQSIVGKLGKPSKGMCTGTARMKIAKPTTLSPIIGTPNKDSSTSQSPVHIAMHGPSSDSPSDVSRLESFSRIPVRRSSQSSSHLPSRSGSPAKDLLSTQLPISGRTSQANSSRSPSRTTVRNESPQFLSRSPSRSVSRASTKPTSRVPSRASSRPSSRMEQAREITNSRTNSRTSGRNTPRSGRVSISPLPNVYTPDKAKRKSISLSPKSSQRFGSRRVSISPPKQKLRPNRSLSKTRSNEKSFSQRTSRSRIPRRTSVTSQSSISPPKPKSFISRMNKFSPTKSRPAVKSKESSSVRKATTSARKVDSSVKRTPSSVTKPSAAAKKQPSIIQKSRQNVKDETTKTQKKPLKKESPLMNVKKANAGTKQNIGNKKSSANTIQNIVESKKAQAKPSAKAQGVAVSSKDNKEKPKGTADQDSNQKEVVKATPTKVVAGGAVAAVAGAAVATAMSSGMGGDEVKSEIENSKAGSGSTGSMRKSPSAVTLMRMGSRMSLFNKKRPDSSISRQIMEEDISENEPISADGVNSSGIPLTTEAAALLEKSQKTLENVKNSVAGATDEVQSTINSNLTDLKNMENDAAKLLVDSVVTPTSSVSTVIENKTTTPRAEHKSEGKGSSTQPVEAEVNIINHEATPSDKSAFDTSERNFELGVTSKSSAAMAAAGNGDHAGQLINEPHSDDFKVDAKRRSPDGQGGSTAGSGRKAGSQEEFLKPLDDDEKKRGCCFCCTRLCLPCRRSSCAQCCRRKKSMPMDESEEPVLSATSSATTTNLDLIDEKNSKSKGCWQRLNCCKGSRKKSQNSASSTKTMEIKSESEPSAKPMGHGPRNQSKCGLCLSKVFCCRSVNKVDPTTGDETHVKNCCFCIPCRRKKTAATSGSAAWQDPERAVTTADASVLAENPTATKPGCCSRFWSTFLCCKKKKVSKGTESRRQSIKPPPPEDTRRKLHVDLVEYNSKMKGAIPVLPLYLAWFCAICNTLFPGLGTLLSGFFCICVGIPRFSHYDSAKARLGSFIINTIVAVAQFFCVLFCFVGWGWSIWWGTIMLKCAKKLSKIKKVERLEMEEERRQQQQAEAQALEAAARATNLNTVENNTETTKT